MRMDWQRFFFQTNNFHVKGAAAAMWPNQFPASRRVFRGPITLGTAVEQRTEYTVDSSATGLQEGWEGGQ